MAPTQKIGTSQSSVKAFGKTPECLIFQWIIHDFAYLLNQKATYQSPSFATSDSSAVEWFLRLEVETQGNVGIYLCRNSAREAKNRVCLELSILDQKGNMHHLWSAEHVFKSDQGYGLSNYLKKSSLLEDEKMLLPQGELSLRCEMFVYQEKLKYSTELMEDKIPDTDAVHKLCKDLTQLYRNKQHADLILKTESEDFHVHKAILHSRSPYFAEVLKQSRPFNGQTSIDSPGRNEFVLREVINFMYMGEVESVPTGLREEAGKYGLYDLERALTASKVHCRSYPCESINFSWTIQEFSLLKSDEMVVSSIFKTWDIKWTLSLRCNNKKDDNIEVYLNRKHGECGDSQDESIRVTYKFSIVDYKGTSFYPKSDFKAFKSNQTFGFSAFAKRSSLSELKDQLLPDDTLTILCEMVMNRKDFLSIIEKKEYHGKTENFTKHSLKKVAKNLNELLNSGTLTDVLIKSVDDKFYTHKCILSARSPVFSRMFETDMQENKTNVIEIFDFSSSIIRRMVTYIYTGDIGGINTDNAHDLYSIADKYILFDLKDVCSQYLRLNLTVNNACRILILADDHCDHELKASVKLFLCLNADSIMLTESWQNLVQSKVQLASEILQTLVQSFSLK